MIRLNLAKEPYWLNLPAEVRVKVRPLTTALMNAAQSKVIKEINMIREKHAQCKDDETDTDDTGLPDMNDDRLALFESLLIKALACAAIIEWEGVLKPVEDVLAPINEQTVSDLMDIWYIAQEFWKQYSSSLHLLEIEGNSLRLAASGISQTGLNTAVGVSKSSPIVVEENQIL